MPQKLLDTTGGPTISTTSSETCLAVATKTVRVPTTQQFHFSLHVQSKCVLFFTERHIQGCS